MRSALLAKTIRGLDLRLQEEATLLYVILRNLALNSLLDSYQQAKLVELEQLGVPH